MNPLRGFLMLVAAGLAFFSATRMHTLRDIVLACGLGLVALALAAWHLRQSLRRAKPPRV